MADEFMIDSHTDSQSGEKDTKEQPEWSAVAVRLLQGVVYQDENLTNWDLLLANRPALSDYFSVIGLQLVVDESDAMAYLIQPETALGDEALPKLFRRLPLSYDATLLCIILRDELRRFEEEDLQNERCVVLQSDLLDAWQAFSPSEGDNVKLNKSLVAHLRKLELMKFVRLFEKDPASWEIRRIIKARLPLSELEALRANLAQEVEQKAPSSLKLNSVATTDGESERVKPR